MKYLSRDIPRIPGIKVTFESFLFSVLSLIILLPTVGASAFTILLIALTSVLAFILIVMILHDLTRPKRF